ncbi:hypothetical protein K9L05_00905 [Candidatus Babeliales bacterium]|nr:hypothetical protein [Candidatus Babeliales bacterium]
MKKFQVKVDARNRVCLTKISKNLPSSFSVYEKNGKIILEPLVEIPADEAWLFKPENKKILDEVKKGLSQEGIISRSSFKKYLKD